jgi:uroporphyrinogen decarboxylase
VIDAIKHRQTELTPWAFEITSGFAKLYREQYLVEDVEGDLESHVMFGRYKKMDWKSNTLYEDLFGVHWQLGEDGGDIGVPVNQVASIETVEDYRFPDTDKDMLQQALDAMRRDTEHFRMFRLTYALYERAWSLVGAEELLLNMAMEEAAVFRLFERITEYQHGLLDQILDADFEGVYLGDDWGTQRGLIMGPAYFRKFIKPFLKELFAKVKAKGKYILLHSCGNIEDVFPDLIEIGLDVYNTVQPEIYNLKKIKTEYGKDLTFWGAISTQQFLPQSCAEEVFDLSAATIRTLGEGGGYIFSPTHAVTPDIPVANIRAMLDAARSIRW